MTFYVKLSMLLEARIIEILHAQNEYCFRFLQVVKDYVADIISETWCILK